MGAFAIGISRQLAAANLLARNDLPGQRFPSRFPISFLIALAAAVS